MVNITALGCIHGQFPNLIGGDLLIITGDLTQDDSTLSYIKFIAWLRNQKYTKKILIAGNHDNTFPKRAKETSDFTYLYNSGTSFEGLKIWGSPNSVWFPEVNPHCKAFMKKESQLNKVYSIIPEGLDILITHGPPHGVLDKVSNHNSISKNVGSTSLLKHLERVWPRYHFFSHIHEGYGYIRYKGMMRREPDIHCYNCSILDENYDPKNQPINIEI